MFNIQQVKCHLSFQHQYQIIRHSLSVKLHSTQTGDYFVQIVCRDLK